MKHKVIRTQRLCGWLMYKGYIMLRMDKNKKDPRYDVYIFRHDDGIEAEIDNYVNIHKTV